jgi:hypothetical protein
MESIGEAVQAFVSRCDGNRDGRDGHDVTLWRRGRRARRDRSRYPQVVRFVETTNKNQLDFRNVL